MTWSRTISEFSFFASVFDSTRLKRININNCNNIDGSKNQLQQIVLLWTVGPIVKFLMSLCSAKSLYRFAAASLLILGTNNVYCQSVPCEFSWASAPTVNGSKNFITPVKSQPYQGPCLAFAYVAAIEAKYAIENNISNPDMQLSDAYLDYKIWGHNTIKSTLESGFKIPVSGGINIGLNTFPPNCVNEQGCNLSDKVKECIDGERNYLIEKTTIEVLDQYGEEKMDVLYNVLCKNQVSDYVTVRNVNKITSLSSVDDLKRKILNEGPVAIRVNGLDNARKFRDYNISTLSYHAFVIIGWTKDSRWIIKDSWPSMSGIVQTKSNIDLIGLLNSDSIELYQVTGISHNGSAISTNLVALSLTDCSAVPVLSNIQFEIEYAMIDGYMYHKFWVSSDKNVDKWVWGIDYPNGSVRRSQIDTPNYSSILLSPTTSGNVTVFVNGFKDGIKVTKEIRLYLNNWQSSGGGSL